MTELYKRAFQNLTRKKNRTLLTVLSIAISVASVVLISTIGQVGTQAVSQEIHSLGLGSLTLSTNTASDAVLDESHLALLKEEPEILSAVPVLNKNAKVEMRALSADGVAWGIDAGANQIFHLELLHGRLLKKEDIRTERQVCLVDETMAQTFYKRSNIVGKDLKLILDGVPMVLEIVGVVSSGGSLMQNFIGEWIPSFVYLPYSTLQQRTGQYSFDQIALQLDENSDPNAFSQKLITILEEKEGRSGIFQTQNVTQQKEKLDHILSLVADILSIIAGISLVVAGLGIMTVMLASVNERTREIGIKKSIGATQKAIIREFLAEALLLSFLGSAIGALFGIGASWAGCLLLSIDFLLDGGKIFFTIVFSVMAGLIFGAYPSFQAAKMDPVEALRYER